MKNAHERFGKLLYSRQTEKTATNLRVFLDAFVGEEQGKAHLVSVVGGDVEIGALAAAFANGDSFTVMDLPTVLRVSSPWARSRCAFEARLRCLAGNDRCAIW